VEPTRFRINMPPVIHQTLDGEVIVVNLDSGVYYSLVGSAAGVWASLEEGASAGQAVEDAVGRYDAPRQVVEAAVTRFVDELHEEGLIVEAGAEEPRPAAAVADGAAHLPFAAPVLDRYTDMQELLILDPIHEVDDAGWPHTIAGGQAG
jgi:hypothetical protein